MINLFSNRKFDPKARRQNYTPKEFEDVEYDRLASKYQRDLKRINNGHMEYGNVKKKNAQRAQKMELDLSGLLKNHKSISEHSSGTEASASFKQSNMSSKRTYSNSSSDRASEPKPKPKIVKRDMRIFD